MKNEPDKAFELLKAFVDKPNAQPPDRTCRPPRRGDVSRPSLRTTHEAGGEAARGTLCRQAETFYRAYLEKNPGHDWELVSLLVRQGRMDEALDLFDRIWDNCSPVVVDQICSAHGRTPDGPEQMGRLSRILQAAVKRFGRLNPLLMTMADLYCRQSHYVDAEEIYRELLQKTKGNASASR